MATAAELFASLSTEEPHIVINSDRSVTIPDELKNVAVQYDHNVETVTFDCPRYWDGNDLSEMIVSINFVRSDKYEYTYVCKNVTVDNDDPNIMHFDWTISRDVTEVSGKLTFIVCVKKSHVDGATSQVWHSQKCDTFTILPGLECDQVIIPSDSEYVGVQADYNQSSETAADYIKNRPFYKESKVYDSFPDADYTTPAYDIPDQNLVLYKISDTLIDDTNFDNAIVTYHKTSTPSEKITITLTDEDYGSEGDSLSSILDRFFIIYTQLPVSETDTIEPGIYSMFDGEDVYCLDSIEFITKVVKVPTMFLPEKDYYNKTESDRRYVSKQNNNYESFENLCLTFNNQKDLSYLFCYSDFKTAPRVSTAQAETVALMYAYCQHVESIYSNTYDLAFYFLNLKEGGFDGTFSGCYSLVNIRFGPGNIYQNISFSSSPYLSDDSIKSIIDGLDTVTVSKTITFHSIVVAKLTDNQLQTIRDKNWNVG